MKGMSSSRICPIQTLSVWKRELPARNTRALSSKISPSYSGYGEKMENEIHQVHYTGSHPKSRAFLK